MSISLGIYDIFANAIPGLFYLFVFNEIVKALGLKSVDLASIDNLGLTVVVALVAYVVGHIMDFISYRVWFRAIYKKPNWEKGFDLFQKLYPGLKSKFKSTEATLLFSAVRYEKFEVTTEVERVKATGIMLRNISFASFLFALLEMFFTFKQGFSFSDFLAVIVALAVSVVSLRRGDYFNTLYYRHIFEYAAVLGNSLQEVLKNVKATKKEKGG